MKYFQKGSRTTVAVGAKYKEGTAPNKVMISSMDAPQHQKSRTLLSAAFTPRSLVNWEPLIKQIANKLVDDMEANTLVDIVQALAGLLPCMVMADLFGIPSKDSFMFKNWVDILFQPTIKDNQDEIEYKKQSAAQEYYQYLYPIVVHKKLNPSDDIISDLLKVEIEGERFTEDEVVRTTMLLLVAGVETTSHMLSSTFYSFLYDDDTLYEQLRNDLELVPKAVEEMLRYRFESFDLENNLTTSAPGQSLIHLPFKIYK